MKLNKIRDRAAVFIATVGYVGYLPIAPGTFGSIAGVLFLWKWRPSNFLVELILLLTVFGASVWASGHANRVLDKKDSPHIVVDEFLGIWITMLGFESTGYWLALGFILFRFFDIAKPPPADYFNDKVKSGFGVVMDDVIAGIYSNLILRLVLAASI